MPYFPTQEPEDDAREAGPLSLADLRDVPRLRNDLVLSQEEIRLLREQLGHALAGWHNEQRRALELEQQIRDLVAPRPPMTPADAGDVTEARQGDEPPAETPGVRPPDDQTPGTGLIAGLLNLLRD